VPAHRLGAGARVAETIDTATSLGMISGMLLADRAFFVTIRGDLRFLVLLGIALLCHG
jgi:hypothetical protein